MKRVGRLNDLFLHPGVPRARSFPNGMTHCSGTGDAAGREADNDSIASAQGGEVLGAIEHQVGSSDQQQLILLAGRLSLHGVDDNGPSDAGGVGERKLYGCGKGPAAAAGQT